MPLPDANKDKRLYALLKNQDLENLSYSDFQKVAQSVFVEGVNEDDLRRICLIQMGRMAVAGEWNGWLNAGGGGGGAEYGVGAVMASTTDLFIAGDAPPFGGVGITTQTLSTNQPNCYPFICAKTGSVSTLSVRVGVGGANNLAVGIYADSGSGYPTTQIGGTTTLSTNVGTNSIVTASPASTINLVQGTKYWMCYVLTTSFSSVNPSIYLHSQGSIMGWNSAMNQDSKLTISDPGSTNSLPGTMPTSGYTSGFNKKVRLGIEYA